MPTAQRGSLYRQGTGWAARYYDETGRRRRQAGFETKTDAGKWLSTKLDEVEALRRGDVAAIRRREMPTLAELVDEFLGQHPGEANTIRALRERLRYATHGPKLDGAGGFAELRVDRLDPVSIAAWRKRLPERSAWGIHKALRQLLSYAVRTKLLDDNAAAAVANPEPKRREIQTFATIADVEAVAELLVPSMAAIPIVAVWTGLRPEEWIALERGDVDRDQGLLHVRRVFTDGRVKLYGKNDRSLRAVPLPTEALQAIDATPARIDTPRLFTDAKGRPFDLHWFRRNVWQPTLQEVGLARCSCGHLSRDHAKAEKRCRGHECSCRAFKRAAGHLTPYALRHTYASWAIASGIGLFELARIMGTSVEQIDRTYGHLLPDTLDRARAALEAFAAAAREQPAEARG